ncbi:MAG TPA: helix-turn-helix transcriptional regulator [Candidatus Kapabacteria bacterium]|nr:helix-turn-helix transcriptional regulator [Candidatus Kapabacteria bacterium]
MKNGISKLLKRVGKNLRKLREAKGVSQEKFAELCDLHRNYIGEIERGEANLTFITYERICKELNVDPATPLLPDIK